MTEQNSSFAEPSPTAWIASGVRFLMLSVLSLFVNVGLTISLHELCYLPEELAFAMALVVVFTMNFFLLRYYVYDGIGRQAERQFIIYAGSALAFRGTEYVAFLVLHSWLRLDYRLAVVGIAVGSACAKFFYYRFVFEVHSHESRKKDTQAVCAATCSQEELIDGNRDQATVG